MVKCIFRYFLLFIGPTGICCRTPENHAQAQEGPLQQPLKRASHLKQTGKTETEF